MWAANVWDPALIIAQMVVLQCGFYLIGGAWLVALHHTFGAEVALRHLLLPSTFDFSASGWPAAVICLLTAPACAWLVVPVVGRAKLCLDFLGTVYGYHMVFSWAYGRAFPTGAWWWVCHIGALTGSVVLAEFLCMRKEMEAIPMDAPGDAPKSPLLPHSTANGNGTGSGTGSGSSSVAPPRTSPAYGARSLSGGASSSAAASAAAASDPDRVSLITIEPDLQTLLNDENALAGLSLAALSRDTSNGHANGGGGGGGLNGVESSPSFAALDRMVSVMATKDRTH